MRTTLMLALALGAARFAAAQPQPQLERVGQGIGDIGPSSVDTRVPPTDLRQPLGFEGVYRVGARGAGAFDARPLVRISGATLALFPRSEYMHTRGGLLPQIPAGTIFYLGQLPEALTRPPQEAPEPSLMALPLNSHELEMNYAADLTPRLGTKRPAPMLPSDMFSNEEFRRGRMARLLALPPRT